FVICPKCGQVVKCHACDVALTYHKGRRLLLCHTCDAERSCPPACPSCRATNLHYGGIGTERLEREVELAFPHHVARRMDSDTMRTPGSHEQVLAAFRAGAVQILLGTQMIAKGLDFPNVTLVGVVDADVGINLPDFRASERCFQLVSQVAGRAGRGEKHGDVIVQTRVPDHHAVRFAAAHDYEGFAAQELEGRHSPPYPPFSRLANVIVSGFSENATMELAQTAGGWLHALIARREPGALSVIGPAPCPVDRVKKRWRWHLLLKAEQAGPLTRVARYFASRFPVPASYGLRIVVDRDPASLL
ncbi:MAG TPA: primosomal protein N', partial [Gemmatimonadaceae bacterium]